MHHLLSHTAGITNGTDLAPSARYEVAALAHMEVGAPPGAHFIRTWATRRWATCSRTGWGGRMPRSSGRRSWTRWAWRRPAAVITYATRKRMAVGYRPFYDDRPPEPAHGLVPRRGTSTAEPTATRRRPLPEHGGVRAHAPGPRQERGVGRAGAGALGSGILADSPSPPSRWTATWPMATVSSWTPAGAENLLGHDGGTLGYRASILADLDGGLGVVVLSNGPRKTNRVARAARSVLSPARSTGKTSRAARSASSACDRRCDGVREHVPPRRAAGQPGRGTRQRYRRRRSSSAPTRACLVLEYRGERVALAPQVPTCSPSPIPSSPSRFGRVAGRVWEAFLGPRWYV